ncbi:RHS repeat-associated core domain [Campylobacter jejuni]|nr:RHS repeat-associated core domain [Campylobacter jejuni]
MPTLVARLEQDADIVFPPEVAVRIHRLEQDLRAGELCEQSRQLLAASQLTPARLLPLLLAASQLTPARLLPLLQPVPETAPPVVHLYCCDHLGTPLALINQQGQHYDEESGLYYNRHRYYDPTLGSVCS